ncbi:MAG: hypothetical protein COV36_00440 [Alphaproteobacteria bacterium CG11_big_fil_rev_8_21_14_0_20_44_7]|nr:MAG: hypothetical protein COV36_00440 [Alphaproteobacteria bacterium CG11_big_fil_rev_8_21_14_0_20_44_7]
MLNRKEILIDLLGVNKPIQDLITALSNFEWDSDVELVVLSRNDVAKVLREFISGKISSDQINLWANTIEGRDDIGFENDFYDLLKDIIFELANPELEGEITIHKVRAILKSLE